MNLKTMSFSKLVFLFCVAFNELRWSFQPLPYVKNLKPELNPTEETNTSRSQSASYTNTSALLITDLPKTALSELNSQNKFTSLPPHRKCMKTAKCKNESNFFCFGTRLPYVQSSLSLSNTHFSPCQVHPLAIGFK